MIRALKVRSYPNDAQEAPLGGHLGACRFAWNLFLEALDKYHADNWNNGKKGLTALDTMKLLAQLKKEKVWLYEINAQGFQRSLMELNRAFISFFKHNASHPRFKSKKDKQHFIMPAGFNVEGNRLILPKFNEGIIYRDKSGIPENIKRIIITKDAEGYYASIQYETDEELEGRTGAVGMGFDIKGFITASDGIQVKPLNMYRRMERKLKGEHRRSSRKRKGFSNRRKRIVKLQKIYQRVRDAGADFNHKASTAMAKRYGTVVIEDLNIRGIQGNHHLTKGITDQGWHQFTDLLGYRLKCRGEELIKIERFEPSSGLCSKCESIKRDLKLSERAGHCDVCDETADRNLNADLNILKMSLIKIWKGIPEHTPVDMPLAGCLNHDGISRVSLNQEPPILQGGEDVRYMHTPLVQRRSK